ncbi:hypothetical protein L2E82_36170 [Cichorium intybus]|uniref:Uncharacterized protein n=1 Tax=Cichorium intybus TaxID=13427 RepID=A0ACB9BQS3_CICIN|nr:hypothetical protein L2E82_36170 [Cichorium intybus]
MVDFVEGEKIVDLTQAAHVSMFLGKAGSIGLLVLDTLGSSITSFNSDNEFELNLTPKESKVQILAFEVANTIVKGSNLMQSLSKENIQILKMEIFNSEGVQLLVSTDINELLSIAAADKREEYEVFSREVVRFGDMSKDPQWHNLDRFFARLDFSSVTNTRLREEAEIAMQELSNLAQHTFELYHEFHALDRIEQLYQRKIEEVGSPQLPRKGKSFMILQNELKNQRKLVRNLKKKSLWSKSLAEIMEKLVDVVIFINQAVSVVFEEDAASENGTEVTRINERLGVAGLALHYANLITQINNMASRPTCLPSNIRDTLFNGLPASVKAGLRSGLKGLDSKKVMTMPQIKSEMEKTLHWLVPIATDTTKAHQCFGCVGEWANTGFEFGQKTNNIIRLQTLYHADKQKMDRYILDLIIYLHCLISHVSYRDKVPKCTPARSPPTLNWTKLHRKQIEISLEEKNLLEEVTKRRTVVPGESKSQELVMVKKKRAEVFVSSRSMGSSPKMDLKYANANMLELDVLDGLGTIF